MLSSWADESAGYLGDYTRKLLNRAEVKVVDHDDTSYEFRPSAFITRAEVATLTYQFMKYTYSTRLSE